MNNYKKTLLKKTGFGTCEDCKKTTEQTELDENSKYGGYAFKEICDNCATEIDEQQDSQQGN